MHRNPNRLLARIERGCGQPIALGAQNQCDTIGRIERVEIDCVVSVWNYPDHDEPVVAQVVQRVRPGIDLRPGKVKYRSHRHPNATSIERIGAARCDQEAVEAQSGGAADDRPDIGVIDDVLEDEQAASIGDH